jgi:four helix bundle protein
VLIKKLIIMGNFRHLEVWNEAKNLAVLTYKLTNDGLISKDFGLRDQMRRAAVSVPSNIAEGEESGRNKKGINYFYISKGSLAELMTQVTIAFEITYLDKKTFEELQSRMNALSAKLRKLIQYREKAGFE